MYKISSSEEFLNKLSELAKSVREVLAEARHIRDELEDELEAEEDQNRIDELELVYDDYTEFIKALRNTPDKIPDED